jgi:valyl-tRNA synthetase
MGSSTDWSREAFTMDENLSAAVAETFVKLHVCPKMILQALNKHPD